MTQVIITGPPGSGKSTLGEALARKHSLTFISAGQVAREEVYDDEMAIKSGLMAPEERMRLAIQERVTAAVKHGGYVMEGYPRTLAQYIALRQWDITDPIAIHLDTEIVIAIERMLQRSRVDDNAEGMEQRIKTYQELTLPLVGILEDSYKLIRIATDDLTPRQVLEIADLHLQRYL
jgi:adenylate kinase